MNKLSLFPAVFLAANLGGGVAVAAEVKEVRRTVPLAADGSLTIETYKGSIEVVTWDRPEVAVSARIEPDESGGDRHQAEKVQETEIRIEGSGRSVRIESDYDGVRHHGLFGIFGDKGTLPFVRYEIRMPRTARLEIEDYKSDTRIAGLHADLDLDTYKGRVSLAGMNGRVRLETYKGVVRAEFDRFDRSEFKTYKGDITIALPRGAGFELDADTSRRGTLDSDFPAAARAGFRGRERGDFRGAINGGGPPLILKTYRGSFRILAR